jgi:hypothetical protein
MSNQLYDISRQAFLTGALNWLDSTKTFGVALIDSTKYTIDPVNNQYISDVAATAILARQNLASLTASEGAASAAAMSIPNVTGDVGAIIVYENTGTDTTSQLIAYLDTGSNLPSTYNAETVSLVWDTSSGNGIFKL